jgi:hypothetical protein
MATPEAAAKGGTTKADEDLKRTLEETAKAGRKQGGIDFRGFGEAQVRKEIADAKAQALEGRVNEVTQLSEERGIEQAKELDVMDDLQISEEMSGRVLTQYFYQFPSRGAQVTGLSYAGVKAIARRLAQNGEPIDIVDAQLTRFQEDGVEVVGCLAKAKNLKTGEHRLGYSAQATTMNTRDGAKPDPFATQKALNKAQRNAIRQFIPEVVVAEMYKEWQKAGSGK